MPETSQSARKPPILKGVRILDIAHQYSGANSGAILADLGADVLSVEHPAGSPIRTMLPKKDGVSLWWKVAQRGKRAVTLNLSSPRGREIFLELAKQFDVIIENFRPGTLERWGIGPQDLEKAGANLAMLRISGFGQTGPSRDRPGFGTVAEAMSGFAHLNGFPDGPPAFPSTTLGDGVTSVFGAVGVLAALVGRLQSRIDGVPIKGVEVVDIALFEALFRIIPTQVAGYDQLGKVPKRPGNFLGEHGVLRNTYRSQDDRYFVISAVGPQVIRRVVLAVEGGAELINELDAGVMDSHDVPRVQAFLTNCNRHIEAWAGNLPYARAVARLAEGDVPFGPVYSVAEIVEDPQYQAREDLVRVADPELGSVLMQGIVPKFPGRDHAIQHAGRAKGADNAEVYREFFGYGEDELAKLRADGVV